MIIATGIFKNYIREIIQLDNSVEAKIDLIETKRDEMNAMINVYKALGAGWR